MKEAGQNAASLLKSAGVKRQGAGVGDACNAILTDADTGSGLFLKEAGQNAASLLGSKSNPTAPGGSIPRPHRRQLDKAGAGVAAIVSLADPQLASFQEELTNNIDGYGTSDSAIIGQQAGALIAEVGTGAGNLVPSRLPTTSLPNARIPGTRRQLDKAGAGVAAIVSLADPQLASFQEELTNNIDGYGTSDSAIVGQQAGALIAEVGTGAGNLVPSRLPGARRQLDKAGAGVAAVLDLADPDLAQYQEEITNNVDGYGTSDSAIIGQQAGALIAEVGTGAGNLVPSRLSSA